MRREHGFTLLELLVSLAVFAIIGLACWRLFDGVFRVREQVQAQEQSLRALRRAVAVIERDVLQIVVPASAQPVVIRQGLLNLQRGNWRNPLDHLRSDRQEVSYVLEQGQLWRYSRSLDLPGVQKQALLSGVSHLDWRLYDDKAGWLREWPIRPGVGRPRALEMTLSVGAYPQIRRVIALVEGL